MNSLRQAVIKEKKRRQGLVTASAIKQKRDTVAHCQKVISSEKPDVALAIGLIPLAGKMAIKGAMFNFRVLKALTKTSAWLLFGYKNKPDNQKSKYRKKLIQTSALAYKMASNGLAKLQQSVKNAGSNAKELSAKLMPKRKQLQEVKAKHYKQVHSLIDKKRDPAEYAKVRSLMGLKE